MGLSRRQLISATLFGMATAGCAQANGQGGAQEGTGIVGQSTAASQYSAARGGRYLRVMLEGREVHRDFRINPTSAVPVGDMTRVLGTLLLARLVLERRLGLADEVAPLLPGFAEEPPKDSVTVGDLISGTSGLAPMSASREQAVIAGVVGRPGFTFAYGSTDMWLLSAVAERVLREDPAAYLQRTVLDPIKVKVDWDRDAQGAANLASGASMRPEALDAIGQLILDGGRRAGNHLVDPDTIKAAYQPGAGSPFGAGLWTFLDGVTTEIAAFGKPAGDRVYVIPARRLVIVRLGDGSRFSDAEFLGWFDVVDSRSGAE